MKMTIKSIDNGFLLNMGGVESAVTTPPYEGEEENDRYYRMDDDKRLLAALLYEIYDYFQMSMEDRFGSENLRIVFDRKGYKAL
jgi:hypothetical protein